MPTCSPFKSWLITSNISSVLIVFSQFFTWIALGDVNLHISLMFVIKANAVEEETRDPHDYVTNVMHTRDWWCDSDVTFWQLPAGDRFRHRLSVPNPLKQKLSRKFKKWCKFSSHVKMKSAKRNCRIQEQPIHQFSLWLRAAIMLTFWHRNHFFNFSTPVYKMWIIQEPNKLELWNKLHFEERKKTESIQHV
jgi:hypothetical protein